MFHTMYSLSGYGWGKLGEVKLPYNPVISTLSERRRRDNRTNTQHPLGKIRCDGSCFKDYSAEINANGHSPGHVGVTVPRYFACFGTVHCDWSEGKWTRPADWPTFRQTKWDRRMISLSSACPLPPPSQKSIRLINVRLIYIHSNSVGPNFCLLYHLKSAFTSEKW